jgi:hypothetical protein
VNYKIIKTELNFENYLLKLDFNLRVSLCRFRCCNVRMPRNCSKFNKNNVEICNLCNLNLIGDEFHYLFVCSAFKDERVTFLKKYYYKKPSTIKMKSLFDTKSTKVLKNLAKFTKIINDKFI